MKIAFYYHIPVYIKNGKILLPGFLGVFIDHLARLVSQLTIIMHEVDSSKENRNDYELTSPNVNLISLGVKTPAWHRELFHKKLLKSKLKAINHYDAFIIRSPTPLSPYFYKYTNNTPIWYLIVGDYVEGADHLKNSTFRDKLIYLYLHYNDFFFQRRIRKTDTIVNSPALFRKYEKKAKSIHLVKTTTISINSFHYREDTCLNETIQLLYTGRIDPAKGIFELVEATVLLLNKNIPVQLNIVGWEDSPGKEVEKNILKKVQEAGISDAVTFHGRKQIGIELDSMYRMADIYILPSYHEGFPRTIWEAMANGLPVIATSVGGIPEYLQNHHHAILIAPKSPNEILSAVELIISNQPIRKGLIQMGYAIASDATLEKQSMKLIDIICHNKFQ